MAQYLKCTACLLVNATPTANCYVRLKSRRRSIRDWESSLRGCCHGGYPHLVLRPSKCIIQITNVLIPISALNHRVSHNGKSCDCAHAPPVIHTSCAKNIYKYMYSYLRLGLVNISGILNKFFVHDAIHLPLNCFSPWCRGNISCRPTAPRKKTSFCFR